MTIRITAVAIAAAALCFGLGVTGARAFTPAPVMPPTAAAPPPPLPAGSVPSPILRGPGGIPFGPQPTYSAPAYPGPLTQQRLQSYRTSLLNQKRQLERAGISPANPRYRDIQQQLQQLNGS
jgi:hypothetical protein